VTDKLAALLGALNAFIAVAAGAFGAHGLRARLSPESLDIWKTAAQYQMFHALGLFAVAWLCSRGAAAARPAGWLMLAGIIVFSGSLYLLSVTGLRWLGAVTPIGGLCFLASWLAAAWAAFRLG
jgi:uncharacterized membrane protein YgdD (TMEM256/DUF423 family)